MSWSVGTATPNKTGRKRQPQQQLLPSCGLSNNGVNLDASRTSSQRLIDSTDDRWLQLPVERTPAAPALCNLPKPKVSELL